MWSVGCGMLDVECWMWNVRCEMMDAECGIWNGACGTGMFSHRSQLDTETVRAALSKNTDFTDAHGWVFSRIVYSCSAAYCLGFDAPPARRMNLYFLLHSVMANDMSAKVMPTMHTPNQLARFHTYPAQNVPSEPPIK